jgi:hypothetical protein
VPYATTLVENEPRTSAEAASAQTGERRRLAPACFLKICAANPSKAAFVATCVVNLVLLSPLLRCGYNGDDLINASMPGILAEHASDIPSFISFLIDQGFHTTGRFSPFVLYYIAVFAFVRNLIVFRVLGLSMISLNLVLFACLIRRLTASPRLGIAAAILPPLLFQFRVPHDPILSFCFLLPMLWTLLLGSLLLLDHYLGRGARRALAGSLLLYAVAILTYEIAWPCFVLHFLLIRWRPSRVAHPRRRRRAFRAFATLALLFVVSAVGLKALSHQQLVQFSSNPGPNRYVPTLNLSSYANGFAKQATAALPLSYRFLAQPTDVAVFSVAVPSFVLLIFGAGYLVAWARFLIPEKLNGARYTEAVPLKPMTNGRLALLGLALALLPGTLIALSPPHLKDAAWGSAYLPVYLAYYGVALLLLAVTSLFHRVLDCWPARGKWAGVLVLAIACAMTAAATYQTNVAVVNHFNAFCLYPREILEQALQHGLCDDIPVGSRILIASRNVWDQGDFAVQFFRTYTGRHFRIDWPTRYPIANAGDRACYLRYEASEKKGYVILARLSHVHCTRDKILQATGSKVLVYLRSSQSLPAFCLKARTRYEPGPQGDTDIILDQPQVRLLASGTDWGLYEAQSDDELDLLSLIVQTTESAK